jgi:hypothetical protein
MEALDCCAVKRRRIISDCKTSGRIESLFEQPPFSNLVFTPLSDAITTWECSQEASTRRCTSKINVMATVVNWGTLKQTKGKLYF